MRDDEKKAYTYEDLLVRLQKLTPEQRACPVMAVREEEPACAVDGVWIAPDDMIQPDLDEGCESVTEFRAELIAGGDTEEQADAEMRKYPVVWRKGTPLLSLDY